jgi:hypothetical protein
MKNYIALAVIALTITAAQAQHPTHASEVRKPTRGDGPEGKSNPTFLVHRLGSDHAEGITTSRYERRRLPRYPQRSLLV